MDNEIKAQKLIAMNVELHKSLNKYFGGLGKDFDYTLGTRGDDQSLTIYATNKEGKTVFGSGVDIYNRDTYIGEVEPITLNHGSTGSFDPSTKCGAAYHCLFLGIIIKNWGEILPILSKWFSEFKELRKN